MTTPAEEARERFYAFVKTWFSELERHFSKIQKDDPFFEIELSVCGNLCTDFCLWSHEYVHRAGHRSVSCANIDKLGAIFDAIECALRASLLALKKTNPKFRTVPFVKQYCANFMDELLHASPNAFSEIIDEIVDKMTLVRLLEERWFEATSNPAFALCRKRLLKEFDELHA